MPSQSIIPLIKKDHKEVTALLKKALATGEEDTDERGELFGQINEALTLHMRFEEENVYPLLTEQEKTREDALEAEEEHAQVKHLLRDIAETDPSDERWKAKVMVLAEDIRHHVKEEEQSGGLLDQVKKRLGSEELRGLAEQFQAAKSSATVS
jgi:hemerythrin superfamily protein